MLKGQDRINRLAEVRADAKRKLDALSSRYAHNLSYAEVYAQMVLALEDVSGKDAEHTRRYGVALGEFYSGPDGWRSWDWFMANRWSARRTPTEEERP